MRRLHVLMPDQATTKAVVAELKEQGISEHHLHVVANLAQDLHGLPEANVWQKTELAHGIEWGVGLGGAAGLLGGVLAVTFPPAGLVLGGGAILAAAAGGAGVGAVVHAMLGSHEHNHDLDRYADAIGEGHLLLMADVPRSRVKELGEMIRNHHPEAEIGVHEPKSQ
jgi:hypothetical protein